MTAAQYVLALDLSLNRPGAAVLRVTSRTVTLELADHLKARTSVDHGARLRQAKEWLAGIIAKYPTLERVYAKEEVPPAAGKTTVTLGKAHGNAEELLADFDRVDIPQATVKLIVTGDGKAEKGDVERSVREILGLGADFTFKTDDESDATAVALAFLALAGRLPKGKRYEALTANLDAWLSDKKATPKARRDRAALVAKIRKGAKVA